MSEQEHNVIKRAETATGPMNIRHIPTFLQKAAYITALEIASPSADCFRSQNMQQLLATTFPMLRELVLTVRDPRVASCMSMATAAAMHVVPARYPRLVALHLDGIQIAGPGLPPLLRRLALQNHPTGGGARRLEWAAFLSLLNTARRLACVGLSRYLDYVQPSPSASASARASSSARARASEWASASARAGVEGTALEQELDLPELRELYLREGREGTTAVTVAMVPSAPALVRREVCARVVFVGAGGIRSAGRVGGFDIDLRGPQDTGAGAGPPGLHAEIRARAVGEEEQEQEQEQEERAMLEGAARILSCAHVMSVECVHPPWGMSEAKWAVLLSELHSLREIAVVQREAEAEEAEAEEEGEEDDDGEEQGEEEEERRRRRELKAEGLTRGARTLIAALLSFRDVEAAYRGRRERKVERKERYRGYRVSQGGLGGGRRSDREERLDSMALFPKVEAVVVRGPGTFRYVKVLQLVPVGGYHRAGVVNTPRGYAYGCV